MNHKQIIGTVLLAATFTTQMAAAKGARPEQLTEASPLAVGDPGVVWYTTWDTAKEEAKRTNKPIFFMAAAHQCGSTSGTF